MKMEYTPVTSFRRPITAVQLERQIRLDKPAPVEVDKWTALRRLATARQHLGLSDRDLTVLQTLLGFHPETALGGDTPAAIVYPSNKAICERLNGMPCSTMRRHVSRLVEAGVILRRDSPNGKRYVRRSGGAKMAYGFDLTPLAARFPEFDRIAQDIAELDARRTRLRDTVSLMRRDLAGLVEYGMSLTPGLTLWDRMSDLARLCARALRRKLDIDDLAKMKGELAAALAEITAQIDMPFSDEVSTSDAENEQHHQNSDKEYEEVKEASGPALEGVDKSAAPPLRQVLDICREMQSFSQTDVRGWNDMIRLSDEVRPMMGIAEPLWRKVQGQMGKQQAAATLGAILERFTEVRNPSAYLRSLGRKAESGAYSVGPMLRALEARRMSSQL